MTPQLKSINCTQCGAPLELHGGRQVKSICCPYCGSVLDKKAEYKVVEKFLSADRPYSPLKIGQQGILKEVEFTIIGLIKYQTSDANWIEYQLFSPTHGYSWLTYEQGHFVFGHKVRYYPSNYSKQWKSKLSVNEKTYKVIDNYTAHITFVEGELTWIARKNDEVQGLDAIAPPFIYSIEKTKHEEEYSLGEYLFADTIYQAFNINEPPPKTTWIHPAQPYRQNNFWGGLTKSSQFFAKIYLVICLLLAIFVNPSTILKTEIPVEHYKTGFVSKVFKVEDPDKILRLDLNSKLNNSWAFFEMTVKKDNTEIVHTVGKEMYYYTKGSEKKGSHQAKLYFKVPTEGNYSLSIQNLGGEKLQALSVELQQGFIDTGYFWSLLKWTVFFGWIWPFFGKWRLNKQRWNDNE